MAGTKYFSDETFKFLRELAANNNRPWFEENKPRYEKYLKEPGKRFIDDFQAPLAKISKHFVADPRGNGGSLFRIYRDTRFSNDKRPYKTNLGLRFSHESAKDVHAPGYYIHASNDEVWVGCGIWHPDSDSLGKIRDAIVKDPKKWKRARDAKKFTDAYYTQGDSLKRPPRGYDADHPLIEDLKRKDFIGGAKMTKKVFTSGDLMDEFVRLCRAAEPLNKFLCEALDVPY